MLCMKKKIGGYFYGYLAWMKPEYVSNNTYIINFFRRLRRLK